jgi:hypothetical protein
MSTDFAVEEKRLHSMFFRLHGRMRAMGTQLGGNDR